ncbi:MAG: EamA family transporter [Thermoplasmata archaeon]|nr:EamA family transporter [Thermoplasmata archaeon]
MDRKPLISILVSASLFGISTPLAKVLVEDIPPVALAGLLYLGSFAGLSLYSLGRRKGKLDPEGRARLERKDLPWLAGSTVSGGVLAPITLLTGLALISGFSASLLLNLEGLATALIAVLLFKEGTGKRLWGALAFMTAAGVFMAWDPGLNRFSVVGHLLVVAAMVCWGMDNNLTFRISGKDPVQIAMVKSLVAGSISLSIACLLGMRMSLGPTVAHALLLGAFSYGASLVFFIKALEGLGSSRTGAFFSVAPFIGAVSSIVILREWIGWLMFPAAASMLIGVWLIVGERHSHIHLHEAVTHAHSHDNRDMHHLHKHPKPYPAPHGHEHDHPEVAHEHDHWPDAHHRHGHKP